MGGDFTWWQTKGYATSIQVIDFNENENVIEYNTCSWTHYL